MNWDEIIRAISPNTNPGLYVALFQLGIACWQAVQVEAAKGPLTWSQVGRVCLPLVGAALSAVWSRSKTTSLKSPRDGNGNPMVSIPPPPLPQSLAAMFTPAVPAAQPPATTTGPAKP